MGEPLHRGADAMPVGVGLNHGPRARAAGELLNHVKVVRQRGAIYLGNEGAGHGRVRLQNHHRPMLLSTKRLAFGVCRLF